MHTYSIQRICLSTLVPSSVPVLVSCASFEFSSLWAAVMLVFLKSTQSSVSVGLSCAEDMGV